MIDMSIKRISVLNVCHVLKSFVKSTPGQSGVFYLSVYNYSVNIVAGQNQNTVSCNMHAFCPNAIHFELL